MITLTLKEPVERVPLEAEVLCPDAMATLDNDAIRAMPVYLGKKQCRLDDFFTVDGEASDELEIRGELKKIRWIGRGMSRGRINIVGNVGMHLGAHMKGGTIEVSGSASDWVGGEMSGGFIRIAGNAGGQIGAAYRGSRGGMTNGTIIVGGSAGLEIGMAAVVGERMMRVRNSDLGVGSDAAFTPQHHGGDAGDVRLEGDRLEVEHQLHVLGVLERNA